MKNNSTRSKPDYKRRTSTKSYNYLLDLLEFIFLPWIPLKTITDNAQIAMVNRATPWWLHRSSARGSLATYTLAMHCWCIKPPLFNYLFLPHLLLPRPLQKMFTHLPARNSTTFLLVSTRIETQIIKHPLWWVILVLSPSWRLPFPMRNFTKKTQ